MMKINHCDTILNHILREFVNLMINAFIQIMKYNIFFYFFNAFIGSSSIFILLYSSYMSKIIYNNIKIPISH
jgi:site-specific DNA-adenine methylase